ncbi:MAG: ribosome maturation factor RimM [Thermoanaerobaculia bacterium]|nr:ribosome maturation factor RimM [Thermoanaerobaculia bacterium]
MKDGDGRRLPATVRVGRIRKPHGVRGEVAVEVTSDTAERMEAGSELLVRTAGGETRHLVVASSRPHKGVRLVRFEGLDERGQVDDLRSAWLEVERDRVPPAPEGAYYYYELEGCECRTSDGFDLGRVVEVIEDGGGLLLEVERPGRRLLVPFVSAYLERVDIEAGVIVLDLPPGMIETCTSTS